MDLNHLKHAWNQIKVENSLFPIEHQEIFQIIAPEEVIVVVNNKVQRFLSNSILFTVLIFCCQGG